MKKLLTALAFLLCITAGAKAQTGEIGLELMWEKHRTDWQHRSDHIEFSHDGQYIYSVSQWPDSTLVKIDANTGELVHRFDNSSIVQNRFILGEPRYMEITPDGQKIVTITSGGVALIWDLNNYNIKDVYFNGYPTEDFAFSPDSRFLYIPRNAPQPGSNDYSEILIYDMVLDSIVGEIEGLKENKIWEITNLEISNTGDSLFIISGPFELDERRDSRFAMINTNTRQVETILDSDKYRNRLTISKTGKRIAVAPYSSRWISISTSSLSDTIWYDSIGRFEFINDSIAALQNRRIEDGKEINSLQLWKDNELLSFEDGNTIWDICTYEDENGFKVCITGNGWTKMFRGVVSGISEEPELGISIYPNPARDKLNIKLDSNSRVNSIAIYDVIGRKINAYQPNERELNISNLPKGIYLLKIETDAGIISEKVVVE